MRARGVRFIGGALVATSLGALTFGVSAASETATVTLVRLTPAQYQRTIHDIFGASIRIEDNAVDPGARDHGLLALGARKLTITSAELERYETLAQDLAAQVVEPRRRATLIPCKPAADTAPDDACATQFITRVGRLLFRRPLTTEEAGGYVATARRASQTLRSFDAGIRASLAQMLVAPEFLFRVERSEADPGRPGMQRLDAFSRASRLSHFLWNTTPDSDLLDAAQSGAIMSDAGLRAQVERMLLSPRLDAGVRAFFSDMLEFDRFATLSIDSSLFQKFTKQVEDEAAEQTLRTITDHLLARNRDYRDLFLTRDTFLTPSLAALYGVPLPRSQELGGAVPWVAYRFPDGDPHAGVLTHVSFTALHSHAGRSSPTLRGKAMRESLLCQIVPPPPDNVDFSLLQDMSNPKYKTVRDRLTVHRTARTCAGCHAQMDPMGLTFEIFDASGVTRTTENGAKIDTSGEFNGKAFANVAEFTRIIRDEPRITGCVISKAFSYGTQRQPTKQEQTWLTGLETELRQNGVKWRELLRRITQDPAFYTIPVAEAPKSAHR